MRVPGMRHVAAGHGTHVGDVQRFNGRGMAVERDESELKGGPIRIDMNDRADIPCGSRPGGR